VPALTIVSHPQAQRVGERAVLDAVVAGRDVAVSRNAPEFARLGASRGASLDDRFISRRPIWIAAQRDGWIRVVASGDSTPVVIGASTGGLIDLAPEDVARGVPIQLAERIVLLLHLVDLDRCRAPTTAIGSLGMIGDSDALQRVRTAIARVADLGVPVLVRGETGTGKELVARAIHDCGARRAGPFVSVNLGALSRELAAAELFGATRGGYTGAIRDRPGLFRSAHGGTLFLDEIGEASPEVQVMLLRALETGEIQPIGADRPVAIDVRLVAATDAKLEDHIERGTFRAPLLYRLAGYELTMPALRDRREDIGALFYHFARAELAAMGELDRLTPRDPHGPAWLPAALAVQLVQHPWPGNIRQLRNATRQLVIENRGRTQLGSALAMAPGPASAAVLTPPVSGAGAATGAGAGAATGAGAGERPTTAPGAAIDRRGKDAPASDGAPAPVGESRSGPRRKPAEVTGAELFAALRGCAWDLKAAADQLRIPRSSIYDLIDRHPEIRTAGDLGADEIAACHRDCGGDLDAMVARLQVSKRALQRRVKELGLGDSNLP
jgi:two-component system nitrogen regulation response regulator GlnG